MPGSSLTFADCHAWHAMRLKDVVGVLAVQSSGLSETEAQRRLAEYGRNILPLGRRKRLGTVILSQFTNPFVYLLAGAGVLTIALGHTGDSIFIAIVLALNAAIGGYEEWRSETQVQALQDMVTKWIIVIRDDLARRIDGRDIVPGDMVLVESGLQVPGDIRLIAAEGLRTDESSLTGESLPIDKTIGELPPDSAIAERHNMLHAGTIVVSGRGKGIVVATAGASQIGQIAGALGAGEALPLVSKMSAFTQQIAWVLAVMVAIFVAIELSRGSPLGEILVLAVALAVSAVPEGLPIAMTVALSIAVSRMARRNVVVRALPAAEGLGSCTMIATDKTGTLTLNRIEAAAAWLPEHGRIRLDEPLPIHGTDLRHLARAAALAGDAQIGPDGDIGDPIDVACVRLAREAGSDPQALARDWPLISRIAYEPSQRFGASVHRRDGHSVAFLKGAVETVLPMCRNADEDDFKGAAEKMSRSGLRVLAIAEGAANGVLDSEATRLKCLGLLGFKDPLRPEAAEAITRCHDAGIAVSMITGDHPGTALAIARELGLADAEGSVITGKDLAAATPDDVESLVARGVVFARIDPLQKLTIVSAMQRLGHVVAVTGDGVNDAPALSQADLGVAMGLGGTDAARQAADLVVTDDNFASIVAGIEEGRGAYDNVRKVILLLISTGAAELTLFAASTAFALPAPFTAVQLLWLNLVSEGIQDVALAFEGPEPDLLKRPPRPKSYPIMDRRMIEQVILSGGWMGAVGFAFYYWALNAGWEVSATQNALLWLFVAFENAHVLNCRSERRSVVKTPVSANPFVVLAAIGAQLIHVGASYTPGLSDVLQLSPLPLWEWLALLGVAGTLVLVMEVYKALSWNRP